MYANCKKIALPLQPEIHWTAQDPQHLSYPNISVSLQPGVLVVQQGTVIVQQAGGASPIVQNPRSPVVQPVNAPPAARVVQQSPTVVQPNPSYPQSPTSPSPRPPSNPPQTPATLRPPSNPSTPSEHFSSNFQLLRWSELLHSLAHVAHASHGTYTSAWLGNCQHETGAHEPTSL